MGPVAQPVFKTGEVWQPQAGSVRLRGRSVEPETPCSSGIRPRKGSVTSLGGEGVESAGNLLKRPTTGAQLARTSRLGVRSAGDGHESGNVFRTAALLALAPVLMTAAPLTCGGSPKDQQLTGYGSCNGGRVVPLSPESVVPVFKAHGFSVRASTTSPDCQGFDPSLPHDQLPAYAISNDPEWSGTPAANREGRLSCLLRKGPIWGPKLKTNAKAPPSSPIFHGRKTEFFYKNLECTLYPSAGDHANAQVRRLDRAFAVIVSRG